MIEGLLVDPEDEYLLTRFKWRVSAQGYAVTWIGNKDVPMHRLIMHEHSFTDHRNRQRLDNRRYNLRPCTRSQNQANMSKGTNNTSGWRGVSKIKDYPRSKRRKSWIARLNERTVGYYACPTLAALAYDRAAIAKYGEFANPNILKNQ